MSSISWRTWVIGCSAPSGCGSPGQRDVGRVALERRAHLLGLEHRRALVEGRLDRAPGQVRGLAHLARGARAAGRRCPRARSASGAAAAGVGHPHGLELREAGRAGDGRERLLLDRREVGLAHRPVEGIRPARARRPLAHRLGQQGGAGGRDVERLGALGLGDRHAHDLPPVGEALERGAEPGPLGAEGQHQSAGSGRPPRAARRPAARPPARRSPRASPGRPGSRPRAGAARTSRPSPPAPRAGGRRRPTRGRARASRRRARRRCAPGCRRCPGRRRRPGRAPSAGGKRDVAEAAHRRLGDDRDDPRGGGQAARLGHQLGRHEVALGQAGRGGDPRVVVREPVGVPEHGDRAGPRGQRGVHQVLALGHEAGAARGAPSWPGAPARAAARGCAARLRAGDPGRAARQEPTGTLSRAARARTQRAANAAGSWVASSARILRSSSTSASLRPWMSSP